MAGEALAVFWPEHALRLRLLVPQHMLHNLSMGQSLSITGTTQKAIHELVGLRCVWPVTLSNLVNGYEGFEPPGPRKGN